MRRGAARERWQQGTALTLVRHAGGGVQVEGDPGRSYGKGLTDEQALTRCAQHRNLLTRFAPQLQSTSILSCLEYLHRKDCHRKDCQGLQQGQRRDCNKASAVLG